VLLQRFAKDEGRHRAAKNELGLDHNESRSWHGWHRHISPVMFAFAPPSVITPMPRRSKNIATFSQRTPLLICCWSVQEIRRIAIKQSVGGFEAAVLDLFAHQLRQRSTSFSVYR
jgi:hypothetical protein